MSSTNLYGTTNKKKLPEIANKATQIRLIERPSQKIISIRDGCNSLGLRRNF